MVETIRDNLANPLKSKLTELKAVLTDSVLDQSAKDQTDDLMRMEVVGIREALKGVDYQEAARILSSGCDYVSKHPEMRQKNNGLIAMANTFCAISLMNIGKIDQAEKVLNSERQYDAVGLNKQLHIIDLNQRAQKRLEQLKESEGRVMDAAKSTGQNFTNKWLTETIQKLDMAIKKKGHEMDQLQKEMLVTSDPARHEQLMKEHTNKCYSANAGSIWKLETQGIQAALVQRDNEKAVAYFKAAFDVIDQDDSIRLPGTRDNSVIQHVDPEYTQAASSLYAFSLLQLGRFAEAEKRFAKEVERDQKGLNSSDSISRQLNQAGLEYARLQQDKTQEVAQTRTHITVTPMRELRPVMR